MYLIDLDGTILDTGNYKVEIAREFFKRLKTPFRGTDWDMVKAYEEEWYMAKEDGDRKTISIGDEINYFFYTHKIDSNEGATEIIKYLSDRDERIVVLTSTAYSLAYGALNKMGIMRCVETIISMDGFITKQSKKTMQGYRYLSNFFKVPTREMILIDNDPKDCDAAIKAGCKSIGVLNDHYPLITANMFSKECITVEDDMVRLFDWLQEKYPVR